MLGATRMATDLIPLANARGFSPDICSYLTSDIGSYLKGESPLQKMKLAGPPKADVLVLQHQPVPRREGLVPVLRPRVERALPGRPHAAGDRRGRRAAGRLRGPADRGPGRAAGAGGRRRSSTSTGCARSIDLSRQMHDALEGRAGNGGHTCPSPITFFDGTIQMGPAVVLRGLPGGGRVLQAAAGRAASSAWPTGVAAVEGERLRIYWEGMPIWGKLSDLCHAVPAS